MKRNPLLAVVTLACCALAVLYTLRFLAPHSALAAADQTLLVIAGWAKLAALVTATLFSVRCVALLDRDNPARLPWLTLAVALAAFAAGQATLTFYQTFTGQSPFPSLADVWFLMSYPLLIVALVMFAVAYAKSGFATTGLIPLGIFSLVAAGLIAIPLLRPIVNTPGAPLAVALNVVYPSLDLLLLVAAIVLLRLTSRFRGGSVWRLWAALLTGFVFTSIGDIVFAYFSTLGLTTLDPIVHALYLIAYASLAVGCGIQWRMYAPEAAMPAIAETV